MTYTISGNYLAACSCAVVCGCSVDAQPRDPRGGTECCGTAVFHINEGRLDDTDLGGVDFAFYNEFPSHLTMRRLEGRRGHRQRRQRRAGGCGRPDPLG
ncbi:DUF1326 domain-containing protein [Kitasatospora gansuensis]